MRTGALRLMLCLAVAGFWGLGCSDDTAQKLDQGQAKDGAGKDGAPDRGKDAPAFPDLGSADLPLPDGPGAADQGPDLLDPSSSWMESSFKPSQKLMDVMGKSSTEVYAVGLQGTILKYDGSSWAAQSNPDTAKSDLYTLWTGPSEPYVYANGDGIILYN